MELEYSKDYLRTLKRIVRKRILSSTSIDDAISLYISNTQYRVLLSIRENLTVLVCICSHDDYDFRNKNC